MKVLSLCLWRRPKYTLAVLDALRHCAGVRDYFLVVGIDGGAPLAIQQIEKHIDFAPYTFLRHKEHIGCNQNTKLTLELAFSFADYVVHVEDDILFAPDALRYFEWAKQFGGDPSLFTVGAWRHVTGYLPGHLGEPLAQAGLVKRQSFFSCWGWATWADRWAEMKRRWTPNDDHALSWDARVQAIRKERYELAPMISRATNIGDKGGTHRGDCLVPYWAGSPGFVAPAEFTV